MDWISFAVGVFAGMVGTLLLVGAALLHDGRLENEPRVPSSAPPPADTYYAEIEAQAIRRLGARGVIRAEDAERIARQHVERRLND